tara:strand:- start:112 stop:573 length:462 start_codon:yes stop_codon:yes gene_type:complete
MKTKTRNYQLPSSLTTARTKVKSAVRKETLPKFKPETDPEKELNENFGEYQDIREQQKVLLTREKELRTKYFTPQLRAVLQDGEEDKLYNTDESAYFYFREELKYIYSEEIQIEEAQLEQRKKLLDLKKKTAVALKKVTLIGKKQTLVYNGPR